MLPGDMIPPDVGALMRRLDTLEREVRELRAAKTAEATTIGRGGITVKDEGSMTVFSADGTRKLVITDSYISMWPDLVNLPNRYFTWQASSLEVALFSYQDTEDFGSLGGSVELRPESLELKVTPSGATFDGMQWISMHIVGGIAGIGTIGNFQDPEGAWLVDRVTGLNAGSTTINYGITYESLPYPFVTVVAPAAVAWVVTAYTTSGFTINVAAGPAPGSVSVLYWMVRPNVVT